VKTSAPKQITWIIAIIVGLLGIIGHFVAIPFASMNSFWLVTVGFILLALGTLLKDL
jgi:hypothetical protein